LCSFFGININGASRWLSVGGQQFQPSDIAKLAIIMYSCRQISKYRLKIKKLKGLFLYLLLPASTICLLVLPNNFSTSALIFSNVLGGKFGKTQMIYCRLGCNF